MTENKELELYFHIPFCVRKCLYCDFLSAPAGGETKRRYMEALIREAESKRNTGQGRRVVSVFLGGGTPSVAETGQLEELLETVKEGYCLAPSAEMTVEINPGTADREKLRRYRKAGLNRLSIGLQSADDRMLMALGRIHTWKEFLETYHGAREEGFENINVDLMSALPGQSVENYRETLDRVLSLDPPPEHISAYSLILEPGTAFYRMAQEGKLQLPDEDTDREMYHMTKRILQRAGYERYEISNYAREGRQCLHNWGYWIGRDYLGMGLGASSLSDNTRYKNTCDLKRYLADPGGCREEVQVLSPKDRMEEFLFLGLRLTQGVDVSRFARLFGRSMDEVYGDVIRKNIRDGLLRKYVCGEGEEGARERLALTQRGLDVSNYVMSQFLL